MKRPIIQGKYHLLFFALFILSCSPSKKAREDEDGHAHGASSGGVVEMTQKQTRAMDIKVAPLSYKELSATIRANGSLHVPNSDKASISPLYGGQLRHILVHPGDKVRKGQAIATITNPQFVQLQEDYLSSVSKMAYAREELKRQQELQNAGAGTGRNLQAAISELASLEARVASLAQQIRLIGLSPEGLSASNIRASIDVVSPIEGVVSNVFAKVGSYAEASTPIAEVIDNRALHLEINIYEQDLPKIQVGQTIHFRLTNRADREYDAKVYSIGSTFEPDSRTIAVHCELESDKAGLIDGMNITGLVSLGGIRSTALPDEAVVEVGGKHYIYMEIDAHEAGEEDHEHSEESGEGEHGEKRYFRAIEVVRGASQLGYTAVTLLQELPEDAKFVVKGTYFVHSVATNDGSAHEH